ncbi:unnamed protein product [Linum tenue]|uniref:Protein MAINTENANCE OF PSII UNDER HIGH LIGHT 1 n=1 Tax=Linum tenue TaxID=586396 RepID=A0AAV0KGY7_9ROSI|nr:unnamed protein product [Linum tenue]
MALACASSSQAIISSANACSFTASNRRWPSFQSGRRPSLKLFTVRASSSEVDSDCNTEECAPEKEVGKISMDWVAEEKTKVVGTFPPRTRGRPYTGYVEKDTAGQTNIYSVEPTVYVAESAISSGAAGSSSSGAENTAAISGGLALIAIAAASSILLQVNKNAPPPQVQTAAYNGPSLTYYINKFKPPEVVQAAAPAEPESVAQPVQTESAVTETESAASEAPQVEAQSEVQPESSPVTENSAAS